MRSLLDDLVTGINILPIIFGVLLVIAAAFCSGVVAGWVLHGGRI